MSLVSDYLGGQLGAPESGIGDCTCLGEARFGLCNDGCSVFKT